MKSVFASQAPSTSQEVAVPVERPPKRPGAATWLLAVVAPLAAGMAQAGTVIDTTPYAAGAVLPYGEPRATTFGQTFQVPSAADSRLDSFTFFIHSQGEGPTRYRAYVYEWDLARGGIKGDALYTSRPGQLAPGGHFAPVTVRTGGLELADGRQYVAFFSAAGLFDGVNDTSEWQSTSGDNYKDGHFVYNNGRGGRLPVPGARWGCAFDCLDEELAFRMTFNAPPVPEAPTAALLLAGLGVVGGTALRRRPARRS